MVHYDHRRVSARAFYSSLLLIAFIQAFLSAGCGGGGGKPVAHVGGVLTDSFGVTISRPEASVTVEGTGAVGHPDSSGAFTITTKPGTYTLTAVFLDADAGIRLTGKRQVTLIAGQTVNAGVIELSDTALLEGWARYRMGKFYQAEDFFVNYLNNVRSAQGNLGSNSAFSALGWTRARGLGKLPDAIGDFNAAIDGWEGNVDAWVGLAGCRLSGMDSDGSFHFGDAAQAVSTAIDLPGEYSSSPTHDEIIDVDLRAFQAFVRFLNGDSEGARNQALSIKTAVDSNGSEASSDVIEVVLRFTQ